MNLKRTLVVLLIGLALISCKHHDTANGEDVSEKANKQPNIIVFLSDDQAISTIGAYGNKQVKTPNLDKLVENGVSFMNNYATTSICMASRATLMTGMYEYKTGCNFMHGPLHKSKFEKSYPVLLRQAGYYTGFAGKFGFAVTQEGETSTDYNNWESMPIDQFDWWAGGYSQTYYKTSKNKYIEPYADKYPHATRAYGAACSDFIKKAVSKDKPFCLSMSFKAPHRPNTPDPYFDHVYANTTWEQPENYGRENAEHLALQAKLGRQYLNMFKSFGYLNSYQESVTNYHQLIHGVDYAVGMILNELKNQGIEDNTIIVFTSDNGYNMGAHGFGGKVLPYEEGSKTPLIIFDPRQERQGEKTLSVTGNIDIAPTVLDYAGVSIPENMDGKSLVDLVKDPKEKVRDHLTLIQAWGTAQNTALSVVSHDYKYIYWPYAENMTPSEELFNTKTDKLEATNLAGSHEHEHVMKSMRTAYAMALTHWKKHVVPGYNYPEFSTIFDGEVTWQEKQNQYPEAFNDYYKNELKKLGYKGDIYDYEAILKAVKEVN